MLTKQMEIHFYSLINKIREKASEIQYNTMKIKDRKDSVSSMSSTGSDNFIQWSKNLAETAELLNTLQESKTREVEIVNKESIE